MIGNIQFHQIKNGAINYILNLGAVTLKVYSGTAPSSANSFTDAANASNLLLTYTIAANSFQVAAGNTAQNYLFNFPASATASGTGTATWFVLEASNTGFAGNYPYIIDSVSDINGNAVLKLSTTSIVSGTAYDVASLAYEFKQ